jgi:hypothetical protein
MLNVRNVNMRFPNNKFYSIDRWIRRITADWHVVIIIINLVIIYYIFCNNKRYENCMSVRIT